MEEGIWEGEEREEREGGSRVRKRGRGGGYITVRGAREKCEMSEGDV